MFKLNVEIFYRRYIDELYQFERRSKDLYTYHNIVDKFIETND